MKDDSTAQEPEKTTLEEGANEEKLSFELEEGEGIEQTIAQKLKALRQSLAICQKENIENLSGWQRARADFINLKRESDGERARLIHFAEERLIEDLLPVLEGYDSATRNKEAWAEVPSNWRVGVEHLFQKLIETLEERGLKRIRPESGAHQTFDPAFHTAVESIETQEKEEDGKILEMISEGYTLHEKVLQPAKVKVGIFKEIIINQHE